VADDQNVAEEQLDEIEYGNSRLKRAAVFLRSAIPSDPWQLLFLAGTIFLFIAPRLTWRPETLVPPVTVRSYDLIYFLYPIMFSGLAAYFTCFWSGHRAMRRILWLVFLPAVSGLGSIVYEYFHLSHLPSSVLESRHSAAAVYEWIGANLWKFPAGLYFCFLGLLLVAAFTLRIGLGLSSLPIALRQRGESSEAPDFWNRYRLLIFVLVCPIFLLAGVLAFLMYLPYFLGAPGPSSLSTTVLTVLTKTVDGLILVGIAFLLLGKAGMKAARKAIRLPKLTGAFLAILLPLGVSLVTAAIPYLVERASWAAYFFGQTSPPVFSTYFDVSGLRDPWLAFLILGAFGEEIVFRGLLLPQFFRRYGVRHGIFFVGIVWAAIHFRADSYAGLSFAGVLYHLAWRILACLVWNLVFCWMTLRWRSIIPSGIAHTTLNVIGVSGINGNVVWSAECGLILWGIAGAALFHYWPVSSVPNDDVVASNLRGEA